MPEGRQIQHHGEAIVLRTWPFHEADLLVSLFTRNQGKVKGVARHAMKSRKRFGGALEPATQVRAHYTERPRQDLVRLDQFEILWSPLTAPVETLRLAALQLVTEVLEEAMPDQAPEDNIYRLAVTVLTSLNSGSPSSPKVGSQASVTGQQIYLPITYFCLWMNRLMGWMPELGHCAACGLDLRGQTVYWSPTADGVTCSDDRRPNSRALIAASVAESHRIARTPLADLLVEAWPPTRSADLRAFAIATLERHLERRLRSATALST
ncbi:MAG TPA: DNA repair protein RecO [Acidobacteriaceae bacterium]|jgi:DNA repair protein RecO (recombination protein O)|nr:DNA repair protein RecO [Acidobacteriaceae bacterium]